MMDLLTTRSPLAMNSEYFAASSSAGAPSLLLRISQFRLSSVPFCALSWRFSIQFAIFRKQIFCDTITFRGTATEFKVSMRRRNSSSSRYIVRAHNLSKILRDSVELSWQFNSSILLEKEKWRDLTFSCNCRLFESGTREAARRARREFKDASHAGTVPRMPLRLADSHFVTTPLMQSISECSTIGKHCIIARAFLKITSCFFLPKILISEQSLKGFRCKTYTLTKRSTTIC